MVRQIIELLNPLNSADFLCQDFCIVYFRFGAVIIFLISNCDAVQELLFCFIHSLMRGIKGQKETGKGYN